MAISIPCSKSLVLHSQHRYGVGFRASAETDAFCSGVWLKRDGGAMGLALGSGVASLARGVVYNWTMCAMVGGVLVIVFMMPIAGVSERDRVFGSGILVSVLATGVPAGSLLTVVDGSGVCWVALFDGFETLDFG